MTHGGRCLRRPLRKTRPFATCHAAVYCPTHNSLQRSAAARPGPSIAERRAGQLLREMAERGERDDGKGNRNPDLKSRDATPKLADLGVTKTQSSRWQRLAEIDKTP